MNLSKFITYCTLKNYVRSHNELKRLSYDDDTERHFVLSLQGRGYSGSVKYARVGDKIAILRCSLWDHGPAGANIKVQPSLNDLLDAFIPS